MSHILKYLLLSTFLILSKSEIKYSSCIDNKRSITLEDGTIKSFDCIECDIDKYTIYNEDKLKCIDCPEKSHNYGHNIIIDTFTDKVLSRYSPIFTINCDISDKNLCPIWKKDLFSVKLDNINDNINSKSTLKLNQYYVNDGEFVIKYINYNGNFNRYLHIYINDVLVYKDDTKHSIVKTRKFKIKKGNNEIEIQYIIDKNLELECQKYDNINELKNSILNNCEYDVSKCNEEDFCTYRFFNQQSKGNNIQKGTQEIYYQLVENAKCEILTFPEKIEIQAEQCSYGQFRHLNESNQIIYKCASCNNNLYNDKLVNYEYKCEEECDITNKNLKKINYINYFEDPSQYNGEINIIDMTGYIEVNYEKFNYREDSIIYFEINEIENNNNKTYQLINPDKETSISNGKYNFKMTLAKGKFNIQIKGKNLNLKEIKIINGEEGGNYKCEDKLNQEQEVKCQNEEYYSSNKKICIECPEGFSYAENSKCILVNQIINNKFILDNSLLLNGKLLTNQYEISKENDINYYLFLNPTFPLIYKINIDNSFEIIGNELDRIKLVRGINERGIILTYIHKDNDEKNKNYTSFIYIKCDKSISESKETLELIKEETVDNNIYFYFSTKSSIVCPYCIESEIKYEKTDGKCIDNKELFNILIKDESECVIKPYDNSTSSQIIIDKNSALLLFSNSANKEDKQLIEAYKIEEQVPIFYEKDEDSIINETTKYLPCSNTTDDRGDDNKDNDSSLETAYIVLIAIGGFFVIVLIGVIAWAVLKPKKMVTEINTDDVQELNLKTTVKEDY